MRTSTLLILACLALTAFTLPSGPKVDLIGTTPVYPYSFYQTNIFEINNTRLVSFTGGESSKIYEAAAYNFDSNNFTIWNSDVCLLGAEFFLVTENNQVYCVNTDPRDRTAYIINKINPFPIPKVLSQTSLNLGVDDTQFVGNSDNIFIITSLGYDSEPIIYTFNGLTNAPSCAYSPNPATFSPAQAYGGSTSNLVFVNSDSNNNLVYTVVDCSSNAASTSGTLNLGSYSSVDSSIFSLNSGSVFINANSFFNQSAKLVVLNAANAQVSEVVAIDNIAFTQSPIPEIETYGDWIWKLNDTSFNVLTNHSNWVFVSTYYVNSSFALVKASEVPLGLFNISFSLFVPGVNLIQLFFDTNLYSEYAEISLASNNIVKVFTGNAPAILDNGTWIKYGQYGYYQLIPNQTYEFTFLPVGDYFYSAANYSLVWGLFIPNITVPGDQCYLVQIDCAGNSVNVINLTSCPYTLNLLNNFELQDVTQIGENLFLTYQSPYGDIWVLEQNQTGFASYYVKARENLLTFTAVYPNYPQHTLKVIPANKNIFTYNYLNGQYLYNQSFAKNTYGYTTVNSQAVFTEIHLDLLTTEYQILNLTTFKPVVDVKREEIAIFTPLKKDYDAAVLGVSFSPSFSINGWVNAVVFQGIQRARVYDFTHDLFTDVNVAGPIIPVNDMTFAIQTVTTTIISQFNVYKVKFSKESAEGVEI